MRWMNLPVFLGLAPLALAHTPPILDEEPRWEISGNVFYSDPPGSDGRVAPILYADRGPLHLEARYNYEDVHTGSLFAGWTFQTGEELEASFTPMLGVVVGDTDGVAPGLEFDLAWKRLNWYAEMEYVFDSHDSDDDFFYSWSTLTYGFNETIRAGLVAERSKLVDTNFSVQPGVVFQFHHANYGFSFYAYDLGTDDFYGVVSFDFSP